MSVKTNKKAKTDTAVALAYAANVDKAPRVIAKGKGWIARKILDIAHSRKIPVYLDAELTRMLYQVSLDKAIPVYLYELVAEVLAWVYSLDAHMAGSKNTEV